MIAIFLQSDALLRGGGAAADGRAGPRLVRLLAILTVFSFLYGGVMGTFGGVEGGRVLQVLYSALKVPMLLLVTFAVSLPSFFVVNTLAGVRDDFPEALRALVSTQAGLTLILASLAPLTALWYLTSADYPSAILYNALMFGVASLAAQRILRRLYGPLIGRNPVHRKLLMAWLVTYAFVGIQTAWVLRPFVGDPSTATRFFRENMWGNAYESVAQLVWATLIRH